MNNVQIQLISPQTGYLDIGPEAEVPLNFNVSDIQDITKRQGTFSKTIKLLGTSNNNLLLNNYYNVNVAVGTFDINRLQTCQIFQNGVPLLKNGTLKLVNVTKVQNNNMLEELVEYDVVIQDSISDFFTSIQNKELTDLEFGEYDHYFNASNIITTLNNTYQNGYKYFFPNINDHVYNLSHFKPAIFAREYFDKIIGGAGFVYEWSGMTASTTHFNELLIPYNGDQLQITAEDNNFNQVIATKSADTSYSAYTVMSSFTETQDFNNVYDPSTGLYTNLYYVAPTTNLTWNIEIEYDLKLRNYESNTVYLVGPYSIGGLLYNPEIKLRKNNAAIYEDSVTLTDTLTENTVPINTTIASGGDLILSSYTKTRVVGTASSFPNDVFDLLIGFNAPLWATQQYQGNPVSWRNSNSTFGTSANVIPILTVKNINLVITPNLQSVGFNSIMRVNNAIPKKIKQSDFIKAICTMYNLYVDVDPLQPNKLVFISRDDFYDSGEELDWTYKLAKDQQQKISFLSDVVNKKLVMTYKQDDSDVMLKGYKDTVNEIYGQIEYTFDSEYVRGIDTKELLFSPVTVSKDNFGNILPNINGVAPKNNIKIALNSKQYSNSNLAPMRIYNFIDPTQSGGTTSFATTIIPLISHFNDDYNPTFDINFGVNDYYYYQLASLTNNNLYNLHWRRTVNQMNEGRVMTAYFKLNENDINGFKLNSKIWIKDSWWHVSKIVDYKAGRKDLTKVILVSADDLLKLGPFPVTSTATVWGGDLINNSIRSYQYEVDSSSNTIFGSAPVNINGRNNVVNATLRNTSVYGDNNIVGSGSFIYGNNNVASNGAFIIGDGITGDSANTLYTNNIVISSGGTINGIDITQLLSAITNTNIMTTKIIDIGPWDMGTFPIQAVPHGLSSTEWITMNNFKVIIYDDAQTGLYDYNQIPLEKIVVTSSGVESEISTGLSKLRNVQLIRANATNIDITRRDWFVQNISLFDDGSVNRGKIIFDYIAD
jgi:hypothetical protein